MYRYADILRPDFRKYDFTFRHNTPGVDYRLCAAALTKVVRAILPEADRSYANSDEAALANMFAKLSTCSPHIRNADLRLSLREYSDLVALAPPFQFKIVTAFAPRYDYYFDYPAPPSPDRASLPVGNNTMITQGWFADGSGILLSIHTDLLNAMYENLQRMPGYGQAERDMTVRYTDRELLEYTIAA